jgi:Zn-dependent M28 family amino/carboxypeptidase
LADLFGVPTQEILGALDELNQGKNMSGSYRIPVRMITSYETFRSFEGANVLGFIEGTDKKDEWIIITAHYDHLGTHRGEIYNGADDNASGVAALLEIAHAFALAAENGEHPRRSILFMCPDAEEIGANGSLYYVDHPLVPLAQTIVDVNIDSIGRDDAARPDLKDFVYAYCSRNIKSDMVDVLTAAEEQMQDAPQVVDRTSPPGSDNYIFEQARVPALAFTTGHCADYHTPKDTFRKIDMENVLAITRLIYLTIREIADGE